MSYTYGEHGEGMPVCKRCGFCCMRAFVADHSCPVPEDPQELARYFACHGCTPVAYPRPDGTLCLGINIPLVCQYLTRKDGQYACLIYDTRPKVCQNYFCPEAREVHRRNSTRQMLDELAIIAGLPDDPDEPEEASDGSGL